MRDTSFAVTIPVTVTVYEREWRLSCTVSPKGWDCEPALLWCDNQDPASPWVPGDVWDAAQEQLDTIGSPARVAFEAAMTTASVPFLREAAE